MLYNVLGQGKAREGAGREGSGRVEVSRRKVIRKLPPFSRMDFQQFGSCPLLFPNNFLCPSSCFLVIDKGRNNDQALLELEIIKYYIRLL